MSAGVFKVLLSMAYSVITRLSAGLDAFMRRLRSGYDIRRARVFSQPSSSASRAVLVTHCDDADGFGRALAARLEQRGFLVFATCSSELVATQIRQVASPRLRPVVLDATNTESMQQAVEFVKHSLQPSTVLWGLVNTPGVWNVAGLPAEAHTVDSEYRPLFESNVFGMAAVTAAFMPALMASRGRVVNTGCVTGLMPIPNNISHMAMESAIFAWSEALRREKASVGVTVSTVIPGAFHTSSTDMETVWSKLRSKWRKVPDEIKSLYDIKFLENAGVATWKSLKSLSKNLEPVIDAYENALFAGHPRRVYHVGRDAQLVATLSCLPRSWQDFLLPFFFLYPYSKTKLRYDDVNNYELLS